VLLSADKFTDAIIIRATSDDEVEGRASLSGAASSRSVSTFSLSTVGSVAFVQPVTGEAGDTLWVLLKYSHSLSAAASSPNSKLPLKNRNLSMTIGLSERLLDVELGIEGGLTLA
jgi:hypothetical protein